jgi:hypothetical protein
VGSDKGGYGGIDIEKKPAPTSFGGPPDCGTNKKIPVFGGWLVIGTGMNIAAPYSYGMSKTKVAVNHQLTARFWPNKLKIRR